MRFMIKKNLIKKILKILFLKLKNKLHGINVTVPYKKEIIPF